MQRIEDGVSPLYTLTGEELARLSQGVALGLLTAPLSTTPQSSTQILVRFHSASEAERVKAYIA